MGHVRMMGAAQPFISGAISKTVNMPEHVTVEEVEQLFVESWKLGLKAVAIYRDNCKVAQPMSADKKKSATAPQSEGAAGEPQTLPWSAKKRLPRSRPAPASAPTAPRFSSLPPATTPNASATKPPSLTSAAPPP